MLAHLDGITSLSIDTAGFSLVSGSHNCSVRFWDLLESRSCVQELTRHREKARGVLDVEFHPSLPFMASSGADGVVKLYASELLSTFWCEVGEDDENGPKRCVWRCLGH